MPASPLQSNEELKALVIKQTQAGDIEAAKLTASRITDWNYLREAWMGILHTQFSVLNDHQGAKETVLSLTDHRLWMSTLVHDLVLRLAQLGDIEGAKTIIRIMPKDSPRGTLVTQIAFAQAKHGDYIGARATLDLFQCDQYWRDLASVLIIKAMVERGDIAEAKTGDIVRSCGTR